MLLFMNPDVSLDTSTLLTTSHIGIAAIRAAATGSDPMTVASEKKGKLTTSTGNIGPPPAEVEKTKKRFGIF